MPAGRPLSIPTIAKRLRHLRDGAFYDQHQSEQMLDHMVSMLSSNPNQPAKVLDRMVNDLQMLFDRSSALSESDAKMLTSCTDSLARIQVSREHNVKAKPTKPRTPHLITTDDPDLDAILDEEENHVRRKDQAVTIFMIRSMLDLVSDGGELPEQFFDAMHLMVSTLDRLCE